MEPKFEVFQAPVRFVFTFTLSPELDAKDHPKSLALYFTGLSMMAFINIRLQPRSFFVSFRFLRSHEAIAEKKSLDLLLFFN